MPSTRLRNALPDFRVLLQRLRFRHFQLAVARRKLRCEVLVFGQQYLGLHARQIKIGKKESQVLQRSVPQTATAGGCWPSVPCSSRTACLKPAVQANLRCDQCKTAGTPSDCIMLLLMTVASGNLCPCNSSCISHSPKPYLLWNVTMRNQHQAYRHKNMT